VSLAVVAARPSLPLSRTDPAIGHAVLHSVVPYVAVYCLLSFEVFGDFAGIFDPVLLSIIIDLSNAMVLCFIYQRKGKVAWHPATVRALTARCLAAWLPGCLAAWRAGGLAG
jgi:hypothetical protein